MEELAAKLKKGNREAWEEFYNMFHNKIKTLFQKWLNNKDDAEDLTQEFFLKIRKNIKQYDEERPFYPWLYRIAFNLFVDFTRREKRYFPLEGQNMGSLNINYGRLQKCIDKLSHEERRLLEAFYIDRYSSKELAFQYGVSREAIRTRLYRIREKLRKCLRRGENEM
ncbi:MAG: RNA polymerase sigma factor [Candidatus Hydrothermae bacterium]|nr:RNA polymerase sigma factor [Candidatus Hydrothermae bacterium]